MNAKHLPAILSLLTALLLAGCPQPDDDGGNDDEKGAYRYFPAMVTGSEAAFIDPYDASLEIFDPATKRHQSIGAAGSFQYAARVGDTGAVAVLDGEENQVHIIDAANARETGVIAVGEAVNVLVAAPVGSFVLAIYDANEGPVEFGEGGMVNYYELNIVDVAAGTSRAVSIDFTPATITFSPDGATCLLGKDYRVVQLDLGTGEIVSFPLTLVPDDSRRPRAIQISPDGEFALVLAEGVSDVYVLDLVGHSINILDMPGMAGDVAFVPGTRTALLPIPGREVIAVVDLDQAIPTELELDFAAERARVNEEGTLAVFYQTHFRQ